METFVEKTFFLVLPIISTALMGYVVWLLQENRKDRREAEAKAAEVMHDQGVRQLAIERACRDSEQHMLEQYHTELMYNGWIDPTTRSKVEGIYKTYTALGGNGNGTKMWEEVSNLPICTDKVFVSHYAKLLRKKEEED